MDLRYIEPDFAINNEKSKTYNIHINTNLVGSIEGYLNDYGEVVLVTKVDPAHHGIGIGFEATRHVINELELFSPVVCIKASWSTGGEFEYCEGGKSSNLLIFENNLRNGLSEVEAAQNTPTGKWAKRLGFNQIEFVKVSKQEVLVNFNK